MNEEDLKSLKPWLTSMLTIEEVIVTFIKQDGTESVMKCTTNPMYIPQTFSEQLNKSFRESNEDVCPVYDLESREWKSFRWDSIKRIEFSMRGYNEA